jgi:hypothetical protein
LDEINCFGKDACHPIPIRVVKTNICKLWKHSGLKMFKL